MNSQPAALTIIGILVLLAQFVLAPLIEISGWRPDLLLIYTLVIASRYGAIAGLLSGFAAGLFQDMLSTGFIGVLAFAKSTVGFWFGVMMDRRNSNPATFEWAGLVLVGAFVQQFIQSLFTLQGSQVGILQYTITSSLPVAIYSGFIAYLWSLAPLGERSRERLPAVKVAKRRR